MTQFSSTGTGAMPTNYGSGNKPEIKNVLHVVKYKFMDEFGLTYEFNYGWPTKLCADQCIAYHKNRGGYISHVYIDPFAPTKAEQFDGSEK